MTVTMDAQVWAEEQFGQCDLKDKRRTQRLVYIVSVAERILRQFDGIGVDKKGRILILMVVA